MTDLPEYSAAELADLRPAELIDIVIEHADRVPRNVIDECASRGEAMVEYLQLIHDDGYLWQEEGSDGEWWLRLHTAMILGLIPGEHAGLLLVELMRQMSIEDDDNLQDWLAGHWSTLFQNKPPTALLALRELSVDQTLDWYIRANAIDPVIDAAAVQGDAALDDALAWLAAVVADETQHWDVRLSGGSKLLDFPRDQYRPLLENMASRQSGLGAWFSQGEVEQAYKQRTDTPEKKRIREQPWTFYEPKVIVARQQRWKDEDERARLREAKGLPDDDEPYYFEEPYVRQEPKTGRNDPCPCGSGKKYKKCCLEK